MTSLMHKSTSPTLEGQPGNLRRNASANPAFRPEFRRSVRMHPALAGSVALVVFLLVVAFALRQKPTYAAESLIYIEPFSSKVLNDGTGGMFDSTKYESSLAQQMLTAQRVDILATALATLPHQVWAIYGATPKTAAPVLQSQLKVARVTTSYQVSISLKGPNAANTAAIVNAVTIAYLEAGRKDEISQADQRSQLLSEERTRIEDELATARAEQTRLGTTLGVANPGVEGGGNPFDAKLDALRSQLVQAQANHDQAAAQLAAISGVNSNHSSGLTAAANDIISNDAGLGSMKATINSRRAQLSSQMAGLTPGNPIYKQDQDELAELDKTLDSMTVQLRDRAARQLQDKLRTDLERSSDVESRINGELARQSASATSASPRLQRAAELVAAIQRLTTRYASVDNALHSLQLDTTGPGMAHLALAASVPAAPEPSKRLLLLGAALPLAILFGLGAAVFARKRDHHVYTGSDVDDILGFPPIAILPSSSEVSDDVLGEFYLRLAAGVEGAYRSGSARTFVITPVSTQTNIEPLMQNLDRKLVELGLGVAILQAANVFEQQESPAAEPALAGFDPAYDRHFDGIAATLFSRLKAEHDVILVEAPALLVSAQTEYVARCSDVTLLVAESKATTRGELFQAGALLQRLNISGVGSVLDGLQLQYADSAFIRSVRALEGRSRPARRSQPAVVTAPVQSPQAPTAVAAEPVPPAYQPAVEAAATTSHPYAEPAPEAQFADEIPVESTAGAWYSGHVTTREPFADHAVEPEAHAPAAAVEMPADPAVPMEVEAPAPMALFDSLDPTERRQPKPLFSAGTSARDESAEPETPKSGWLQRIFKREPEPIVSIIPDDREDHDEVEAPVAAVYDVSRYDLPLPVEPTPAAALAEPADSAPAYPVPVAVVVEEPLPEPVQAAPAPHTFASSHHAPFPEPQPEPDAATHDFVLNHPVEPHITPYAEPIAFAHPEPAPAEPFRTPPTRPLSFRELSQMAAAPEPLSIAAEPIRQTPAEQHFEAAVEPEPEPQLQYQPEHIATQEPEPQPEPDPAPVMHEPALEPLEPTPAAPEPAPHTSETAIDDWNPAPLNRWDPIPPLRPQEEPWRSSGSSRIAQQASRSVWGDDETRRIPPTDRWVPAESLQHDAPPAEASDLVLTRRWGLLSRFQQGESFQSTHGNRIPQARASDSSSRPAHFAQDFDPAGDAAEYDARQEDDSQDARPAYDRRRRR